MASRRCAPGEHVETPIGVCLVCSLPRSQWEGRRKGDRAEPTAGVRNAVYRRDSMCLVCSAGIEGLGQKCPPLRTYHHLLKKSQGGLGTFENGVTLCNGHNLGVEDNPARALEVGLVVGHGVDHAEAARRRVAFGLV